MAASAARDVTFSFLRLGTLAQLAARLLQILVIETHMLAKSSKGDPAPLGDLRQRKFSCAKQFHGPGIQLPAPWSNAPLLVVGKTQPLPLPFAAFEKSRTVRTKLIAQTRRVQSEQVRDLRDVVFDILCIAAGRDRVAVLGTGRHGLAPAPPQARMCGVRHRRDRYAVARQQQVAAVLVQIASETRIRYTATGADCTNAQRRRTVQIDRTGILRFRGGQGAWCMLR